VETAWRARRTGHGRAGSHVHRLVVTLWLSRLGAAAAALLVLFTIPWRIAALDHARWYAGEAEAQLALARGVDRWIAEGQLARDSFTTGDARYDAEWLFGTHVMAALGFGQVARAHPAHRDEMIAAMDRALDRLAEPDLAAFDREGWGEEALGSDRGHIAYLGYYGLALGLRGRLGPSRHDAIRERFEEALVTRFERELLVETYPGERYPVDNAAAIGALALAERPEAASVVTRWLAVFEERWRDANSGLVIQSIGRDGAPLDAPRASGTALAAYFLAFADEEVARSLYQSLEASTGDVVIGFGAMKEYPPGHRGHGDVDSGPLIAGFSISGTGFALVSARRFGSEERFAQLWATTRLFGLPRERGDRFHFVLGGPLGDAILFAMLTGGKS
jgi:hypothetical protein